DADKGYQGLHKQVELVAVLDAATGTSELVPRLVVKTPHKKPKGQEVSEKQHAFNGAMRRIRIRVERCIGWAKNWAILATRFRCDHSIYTSVMRTICGFVNAQ
ncbi:MAG: transposase, partial [Chloroflexales bacterium]|nr:transposase [Chloroflexales bacterium]